LLGDERKLIGTYLKMRGR